MRYLALFLALHAPAARPEPVIDPSPALLAIATIESSSGRNLNHPEMTHGMHKGDRAAGHYGLMPNTVKYLINRYSQLSEYKHLLSLTNAEITEFINKNPAEDHKIVRFYWLQLRGRFSRPRAAYAWLHGEGAAEKASDQTVSESLYTQRFLKLLK